MLTSDQLAALAGRIPGDPDLSALLATVQARCAPLIARQPHVPRVKALLSRDGGFCPTDGATLEFDPWNHEQHKCPKCGESFSGDRHYRNWARAQHLWIAERIADLALVAALTENADAAERADSLFAIYEDLYFELPNRDNVLGPTHLFFSTYLESLWVTSYLSGAFHLREVGMLSEERSAGVDRVAEEAASLISEFNEGLSNRQTWHAAARTAIAVWFGDGELATDAVESPTGLVGHLAEGFGEDGLWYEGENYHLFALRGLMQGMQWASALGYDLLDDPGIREHFRTALLGPTRSALPDFTYPARRDSRYGVSLAQPASLDLWEIGRGWLKEDKDLDSWLAALYALPLPLPPADHADYWLHDAGRPVPSQRSRGDLSAWALLSMLPGPGPLAPWQPESILLANQGLAVLREGKQYVSLECGAAIGGHGHPDRLHLSVHSAPIAWLPDQGTGSYVHETLAWYRSAIAHNAPIVDGENVGGADASCEAFAVGDGVAWCLGAAGEVRRTVVAESTRVLDIIELDAAAPREMMLPWHFQGEIDVTSPGHWEPATLDHPFVSRVERFVVAGPGPITITVRDAMHGAELRAHMLIPGGELLRGYAPGLPNNPTERPFLLMRGKAASQQWVTVLDFAEAGSQDIVTSIEAPEKQVREMTSGGMVAYQRALNGISITRGGTEMVLGGLRTTRPKIARVPTPLLPAPHAYAMHVNAPPLVDGTLDGFDRTAGIELHTEDHYRRSEEPYNPEKFAARAWINWDGKALYLAVTIKKPELVFRAADAPSVNLDNENEDINSDGLQIYWEKGDGRRGMGAALVIPEADGGVRVRFLDESDNLGVAITGRWKATNQGYRITMRIEDPVFRTLLSGATVQFDLLINEMQLGRLRRAGQLVWSGGGGWIYLRGDRRGAAPMGRVVLQ